ncbi:tetratricopeptide repeat protein [Aquicoccus sp. SCR17]|nr:tetratricopeptide repeat protein [Carideicomes alvinocaridis]
MRRFSLAISTLLALGTAMPSQAEMSRGFSGAYLSARQASRTSDFEAAARFYQEALSHDSGNAQLLEALIISELSLGNLDSALPFARELTDSGQSSQIAHMVEAAALAAEGEYDELIDRLGRKEGIGPLVDGLLRAWALLGKGNMTDALVAFDEVGNEKGLLGFALYHKALALASVGDFEGAEAIYSGADGNGAVQMTRRGAMARIEVLSQLDRNDDALTLLDRAFGAELDPQLRDMRAALEAGETLPFTHVTGARDGMAEVFFSIAGALKNETEDDYTLLYSRIAEYLRPDHIDALLLSAGLLEDLGRYELATRTYRRVTPDNPAFHAAELGRADSLRREGKVEAAIEVMEQLTRTHGDLPVVYVTLGDTLRQQERFEEAAAAYDKALDLYGEPQPEQWFIYYARAISHERVGAWQKAEDGFRTALELNPDQPQVLNYLGYSLVERQEKLDEALGMIERAVTERPDSGYIVDSLGWALYRLDRYEEAVGHMERAVELMPVDPVVNDHLGDVLWAVGREMEARFQWRRALSFITPQSDLEEVRPERIRRKLEIGLDHVLAEEGAPPLKVANDEI